MKRKLIFCWTVLLIVSACRERFEAEGMFKNRNFLVVEGFINVGDGVTRIKLSRVTGLSQPDELVSETLAQVFIEDDDGTVYSLHNRNNGLYESDELNLSLSQDYRLRVEADEKVYFSDYSTPVVSPPVDSVGWIRGSDNYVYIHVNTHDARNNTFYYKWEYEEVWEVRSAYTSRWAYQDGVSRVRSNEEIKQLSFCWPYAYSPDLIFTSSKQLTSDAIRLFPVKNFYITDPRLGWRYSITVNQRALTEKEYEFLQVMKKNTNDLGSFFDAQPSQLSGNMYCTNKNELVVGFVGSYTSEPKQLIIRHEQISNFEYFTPCYFNPGFALFSDPLFNEYLVQNITLDAIYGPVVEGDDAPPIIGFSIIRKECGDCRVRSGNAPKPDFWIEEDEEPVD